MGSPSAVEAMKDWMDEAVLVSARRALITTTWPAEHWAQELTDQSTVPPQEAITGARNRPSISGGRTRAKPHALPATRRKEIARASPTLATPAEARRISLTTAIRISDSPSGHPDSLPGRLMAKISALTETPWQAQQEEGPLQPHRWRREGAHHLTVQCDTVDDLNKLYEHVHNNSIEIDGMPCLVEVENLHHDAPPTLPHPPYTAAPSPSPPLEAAMDGALGT